MCVCVCALTIGSSSSIFCTFSCLVFAECLPSHCYHFVPPQSGISFACSISYFEVDAPKCVCIDITEYSELIRSTYVIELFVETKYKKSVRIYSDSVWSIFHSIIWFLFLLYYNIRACRCIHILKGCIGKSESNRPRLNCVCIYRHFLLSQTSSITHTFRSNQAYRKSYRSKYLSAILCSLLFPPWLHNKHTHTHIHTSPKLNTKPKENLK